MCDDKENLIGYRGIDRDITERIRSEEALRHSEENFKAIFDSAPAAIFGYDRNGMIIQANSACSQLYGFSIEEMVGRSMFDTIAQLSSREVTEDVISRVFAGETIENIEWKDVRANGRLINVLTNTRPVFDSSGNITMGLSLNIDITERKQEEQRKQDLEEHKREFYRRTLLAATEGKLVISEKDDIERQFGPPVAAWRITQAADIPDIRHEIMDYARKHGMDPDRVSDYAICFGEAATNALKHANGGTVSLNAESDGLVFVISDHGSGIDALTLPEATMMRGYSTAGSLGMGYKAILSLADKSYLDTSPSGTTVAVEMKYHAPEPLLSLYSIPDKWAE